MRPWEGPTGEAAITDVRQRCNSLLLAEGAGDAVGLTEGVLGTPLF